ncbi:MAG TPA: DNA adenine methylase [Ideonella sp.]|uniref:DNA adenine methylase n=1 Tax=Ideonella sp. TaxID=1929293 RepID=UPI002B8068D4|nr:DNA adenine methylase [Ideonella sp.]HSI48937.1 DNA adenine methylase [Ideonella sp.]
MSRYSTPLRYPGGKQRLTPFILEILKSNDLIGCDYVEPYAGGAGVAIELLLQNHVRTIRINDSSIPVYAFWKSILDDTENFCRLIATASLSVDEWIKQREILRHPAAHSEIALGFATFFLNRCNRSGVLSGGLIGGLDQSGKWKMDARFSRNELTRRIEAIALRRKFISITCLDAEAFMCLRAPNASTSSLTYCDPPYFEKASRLYLNSYKEADHSRLAQVIQERLLGRWIVSYDSAPQILDYYKYRRSFLYDLQYNASRVYKGREVFVFSDDLLLPSSSVLPYINEGLQHSVAAA